MIEIISYFQETQGPQRANLIKNKLIINDKSYCNTSY